MAFFSGFVWIILTQRAVTLCVIKKRKEKEVHIEFYHNKFARYVVINIRVAKTRFYDRLIRLKWKSHLICANQFILLLFLDCHASRQVPKQVRSLHHIVWSGHARSIHWFTTLPIDLTICTEQSIDWDTLWAKQIPSGLGSRVNPLWFHCGSAVWNPQLSRASYGPLVANCE